METWKILGWVATTIVVGLCLDAWIPEHGQTLANVWVFGVYGYVLLRSSRSEVRMLLICTVLGFLGELFLCFGWGLYTYRLENLPLFVPPGHALLFFAGCRASELMPTWFPKAVGITSGAVVLAMAVVWGYTADLLWFGIFLAVVAVGRDRQIYSVMLIMALLLELLGTYLGAWQWAPEIPYLGLSSWNPPLAAGAFYCFLDLWVLATVRCLDWARGLIRPSWSES